jgi:uncharacterized protein YdaU (DUF1376 family)
MYYYSFDIDKWMKRTHHLLPEEEGIYLRLINHYYDTEKPLISDVIALARRLNLVAFRATMEQILDEYFELTEKGYENSKCEANIAIYHQNAATARKNGRKGGRPRSVNNPAITQKEPSGNPAGTHPVSETEPRRNPDVTQSEPSEKLICKPANLQSKDTHCASRRDVRWVEFWNVYPTKKGKTKALEHWKRKKCDDIADMLIADVQKRIREDDQWRRGFIPYPQKYINQELWQDEISNGKPNQPAEDYGKGGI